MIRHRLLVASTALLSSCLCSSPPTLEGRVLDPWQQPVAGVAVALQGLPDPVVTDDKGLFSVPLRAGTLELSATKEGYIKAAHKVEVTDPDNNMVTSVEILPEPKTNGYHLIGPESYIELKPEVVSRLGNELNPFQGIKSSGDVEVAGKKLRLVFHTPLKMDQVARLDIELHKLSFTHQMTVATVGGQEEVDINLWTDGGKVPFERAELGSDDNYLFTLTEVPSGTYAFTSLNLLDPKNEAFLQIAEPVRRVHPFTVK